MSQTKERIKQLEIKGNELVTKVKELIEEGNTKKIIIKREGKVLMEVPLSYGVGGTLIAVAFAPILAAIGALAALVSDVTLEVVPNAPEDDLLESKDEDLPA
ncbi:MAG: DUF4342 domain-containing protein [Rhodothermia bacterium]|nr:DUF4342 domain-containing protein [Rhodothermia bacterium]